MVYTRPVAIIMPVYNCIQCVTAAITSIILNTKYPFKLIIIESESTDGTAEVVDDYARIFEQIVVYHTKKEGLISALNFGIKMAGDLDVYITQSDVIIPRLYNRDWLAHLVRIRNSVNNVGLITTIRGGGISGDTYLKDLMWVGTWSMYIPRETINKIGVFDTEFNPGCGDDIDYSYRVYNAGLSILEADFWVDHHRTGEHFNENQKIIDKHALYFRKKHKLGEFKDVK